MCAITRNHKMGEESASSKGVRKIHFPFQRSFSDTGQDRPLMFSKTTQTEFLTDIKSSVSICPEKCDTVDPILDIKCSDLIRLEECGTNDDSYVKICSDLAELTNKIQHVLSTIGVTSSSEQNILRKLHVKENLMEINKAIEKLEQLEKCTANSAINVVITATTSYSSRKSDKTQNKNHGDSKEERVKFWNDLFTLRSFPQTPHCTMPFTLEQYFQSLTNEACSIPDDVMSNELMRLSSLSTFPRDVRISLTRLAKTGFYQNGHPGETKCFSCGLTYQNWKSGDNPFEIHKRLSPDCTLVRNDVLTQSSDVQTNTLVENNHTPSSEPRCISGGQNIDELNTTTSTTQNNKATTSTSIGSATLDTNQGINSHMTSTRNLSERINSSTQTNLNNNVNECSRDELCESTSANYQSNSNGGFSTLGINIDKPKYPNYATLQTRISSYQGWPSYLDQTPRDMALAGFLFAGYNDYTRCFFCGGGLRNWEAGDDPWVEHARWFPKCPFLKQNKGERFIQAVMKKQQEVERETAQRNEPKAKQSIPPCTPAAMNNPASHIVSEHDQLRSIAARSVLEMGYSRELVLGALQKISTTRPGLKEISAIDIMKMILDDDNEDLSSQGATASEIKSKSPENQETSEILPELFSDVETQALMDENRQLRDQRLCKVCLDLEATIAFLPCGHIVCCSDCAPAMRKCPLCRTFIKGTVKTFLA